MNADNLVALADDMSKFCVYKNPVLAHLYIFSSVFAVGMCMMSVMLSMVIVWRSHRSANEVSVRHTIVRCRSLIWISPDTPAASVTARSSVVCRQSFAACTCAS